MRYRSLASLGLGCFLAWGLERVWGQDLIWQGGVGYRRAALRLTASGKPGFTLLAPGETGIRWTNHLSTARVIERQNLMNGSGLAAGDFDGDGRCDLYFCNKEGPNALYRNLGDGRFEDVATTAGVTCADQSSTGAVFADLNADGRIDLLVTSFTGPNACLLNLGGGRFTNVTAWAGLTSKGGTTSMALADVDGDGDLDLYMNYFGVEAILRDGGAYSVRMANGQPTVTGRYAKRLKIIAGKLYEYGEPDVLYLNNGEGRFSPVAWEKGFQDEDGRPMAPPPDFGLAVQLRDINGDGAPDIYTCNDFQTPDRAWLNDGTGHFRAIPRLALRNMSYASMGVDFGDLDRDGLPDFLTVEMLSRDHEHHLRQSSPLDPKVRTAGELTNREEVARNAFCWNRGDGTYAEIAFYSGLAASDWSWTPAFLDVDLDGFEDVLVSNGHLFDVNDRDVAASRASSVGQSLQTTRNILLRYPRLDSPKVAFRNRGNLTFEEVGTNWGFNSKAIAHGLALADLDQDGDLDVVVNCIYGSPLIYRNNAPGPRLAVRLKGKSNPFGIGARIEVHGGPVPVQTQEMLCGGRYLSGDDTVRVFAAGHATNRLTIKVTWRNGTQSVVTNALPNSLYEIDETAPRLAPAQPAAPRPTLFEEASQALAHRHLESSYDDFARQPLLPRKFSQLGPGVAFSDLDGDGRDELLVGNGRGGPLAVFRYTAAAVFEPWADAAWAQPATDDQAQVLALPLRRGRTLLLAGMANYEAASGPAAVVWNIQGKMVSASPGLPSQPSSVGPLLAADLDGDGSLEVLVGGRLNPGRYPEAAASRLYRLTEQGWSLETENSRRLEKVGLVSGGVFSDLTGDGLPELILACEWAPLSLWRNDRGQLTAWNPRLKWLDPSTAPGGPSGLPATLQELSGLWQSVTTGDFDEDGRLDIVAGNWGLNSFYNLAPDGPWFLYFGDLNEEGKVQLVEAYWNPILKQIVPWRDRDLVASALPWIRERLSSHQAYASASISAILGERLARVQPLKVNTLASTLLLNRGDHFEVLFLPAQAQWAPVFGLNAADFDGDGHEDLFLSQNFFAVRAEDDRLDAGRGLLLRGTGGSRGQFTPVAGQDSGIKAYGEQRGSAVADYDGDGRLDLVVAQNGAETKLYRNVGARPGLRVKLESRASGNFRALGAQIRLIGAGKAGPVREVHGGSGYWSQDSATQVLATEPAARQIWVRWPGGQVTTNAIPEGAREIVVNDAGQLTP